MTAISWLLEADLDRDGDFETDLTGYVEQPGSGVALDRGHDRNGEPFASRMQVVLNNRSGAFNPRYTSSPFAGQLTAGFPVRLTATLGSAGYTKWTGYAKRLRVEGAGAGASSLATLEAYSLFYFLRGDQDAVPPAEPVYVSADEDVSVRTALEAVATAAGFTPSDVLDLWEAGDYEVMEWHFVSGQNPFEAWREAAASEMGGAFYELENSKARLEPRDARLGTSQFERLMRRYMGPSRTAGKGFWLRNTEFSGTTVYDRTGNGNHGTLTDGPTLKADPIGSLLEPTVQLDGNNDHISIADSADLDVGDTFTFGILMHLDTLPVDANDDVIFRRVGWGQVVIGGGLYFDANRLGFYEATTGFVVAQSTVLLEADTDYLLVITKVGATTTMYLNGVDVTDPVTNATFGDAAAAFLIGDWDSGDFGLPARVGDVWLADDAWTAEQVTALQAAIGPAYRWGDGTSIVPVAWSWLQDEADVATKMEVRANDFLEGQADIPVFEFARNMFTRPSATSMALAAGEIWERDFDIPVAYTSLASVTANTDYQGNAAIDGSGTDKTSALTITVTEVGPGRFRLRIENTDAGTVYLTFFKLRGVPLDLFADRAMAVAEKALPGHPGGRGVAFDIPFWNGNNADVQAYAISELRIARYPVERLSLAFRPANDVARDALLALEVGDLVFYDDTDLDPGKGAYVRDWFYVEGVSDKVPPDWAGASWDCNVRLVPTLNWRDFSRQASDTFTRDDATGDVGSAESGQAWAGDTAMNIVSGAARASSDSLQMPNVDLGALAFDQVIEVSLAAIGSGDEVGVVFRYIDADNQMRCYLDKASNEVILEKNVATTVTEISSPAFTVGTAHELRVIVQGSRIRVWVDHALVIDIDDDAQNTGTRVGLFARTASGTTTFDDVYAAAL